MAGLSQNNLLRDVFTPAAISALAQRLQRVWRKFPREAFVQQAGAGMNELSFLQRSHQIRDALRATLPPQFPRAVSILVEALGPELQEPGKTVWEAFIVMPQCSFVSTYGQQHYQESMDALYEMTKRLSAEGDLRVFLELDYPRTMRMLMRWTRDPSPHVRRLVSEGTRPRLPLAGRIRRFQKDPRPVISLLDLLKEDSELYVRRSVANNVNDIAKDHPDLAAETLVRWSTSASPRVAWVVRHAARTLLKQGHPSALALMGYTPNPGVEVCRLRVEPGQVRIGERAELSFQLRAPVSVRLLVDYVVHYVKANGATREKVFKLRQLTLAPEDGLVSIGRSMSLANTSGRRHYPGTHEVELQINGHRYGRARFQVITA